MTSNVLTRSRWIPVEIPYRDPGNSPVVFLDVDGVLIGHNEVLIGPSGAGLTTRPGSPSPDPLIEMPPFSPVAVRELNRILDETGAKIVLSSSWRFDEDCISNLLRCGVRFDGNLIGKTGVCRATRGDEIYEWLKEHGRPRRFVALDDDDGGMELIGDAFIQTDFDIGLTRPLADRAIGRLRSRSVART